MCGRALVCARAIDAGELVWGIYMVGCTNVRQDARARARARTHARTHARLAAHTHARSLTRTHTNIRARTHTLAMQVSSSETADSSTDEPML